MTDLFTYHGSESQVLKKDSTGGSLRPFKKPSHARISSRILSNGKKEESHEHVENSGKINKHRKSYK